MANIILGLQGGIATGSEATFDGQPMQTGTHLRWSFLAALGFPPGGFWLCRRAAEDSDKRIPPPPTQGCNEQQQPTVAGVPNSAVFEATVPPKCESVTLAGCAAPGCDQIVIETFSRDASGNLQPADTRTIEVQEGAFRIRIQARDISCVRVLGAGTVDECQCNPPDCGSGGGGGGNGGGNPPCYGQPGWDPPNGDGWQSWGVPFTLPLTLANWPARYYGALDPNTTPDSTLETADVKEAERRLGTLKLSLGLIAAQERAQLIQLRNELKRLVQGYPTTLQGDVPLQSSPAGANAPNLNINLIQQLLLLALDPYFARVLGLYFVDQQVQAGTKYDYAITGFWGNTQCQDTVLFPGLAPGAPLARGMAVFNGLTIQPQGGQTGLWRWTKYDSNGNLIEQTDPSAPPAVNSAVQAALSGLNISQFPDALLLCVTQPAQFFLFSPPPQLSIALAQPVASVDVQVAGTGTVTALSSGAVVATASFGSSSLTTVTVTVTSANTFQPIDQITIVGVAAWASISSIFVGSVTLHPISPDTIGTRYAIMPPAIAIQPVPAPGQPITTFRKRQADIDTTNLHLVPHSVMDVQWPAQPVVQTGDPVSDPIALPAPTQPIGFVAERQDTGAANSVQRIPGWVATRSVPKPAGSPIPTANLYRLVDSGLPDPVSAYSHRMAGFDLFGALGAWSPWSEPRKIEKIAAAPAAMRIVQFDNTSAGGGAGAPDGSAWVGGTLKILANWSGASFLMYPDVVTARATVDSLDTPGNATQITTSDFTVPAPSITALTVASVNPIPSGDGNSYIVDIQTTPAFNAASEFDPGQVLMLTLPDGTTERYTVRPAQYTSGGPVVARINAGNSARIVTTDNDYIGQPAFLVSGYSKTLTIPVPLQIPIAQDTARAQVYITSSTQNPFLANEQIVDPNGVNASRSEPSSPVLIFHAPQRLVPPAPPTPVHDVNHVYYDPADATGRANKTLPFTTLAGTGIYGYILQRAPVRTIDIADIKRRIAIGNLTDNNPVVFDGGQPRKDLAAWIQALPAWLTAYNTINGTNWTPANALEQADVQRAFVAHFYDGLLDDELRAVADVPGNSVGYARVNPTPVSPVSSISDSVDGTGYGRTLYRLAAVNHAGSVSSTTNSIGPYYTRIVTPPRPPVLYKVQPTVGAVIIAWALDTNPDVAAYIVYRASTTGAIADLRYFGADWTHPVPASQLWTVRYNATTYPPLSFVQGAAPNVDRRIVGFVPDPRLCARDYAGSDAGEITLPAGPAPDQVNGIYRLSEYNSKLDPLSQVAFNYWTPPAVRGIAQIKTDSPTHSRLTGLRIGLGRSVPVVVVGTRKGSVKVFGQAPVRRAAFTDGVSAANVPFDPNTIPGAPAPNTNTPNAYVIVAVDIFGNFSAASSIFTAQMLATAAGS